MNIQNKKEILKTDENERKTSLIQNYNADFNILLPVLNKKGRQKSLNQRGLM